MPDQKQMQCSKWQKDNFLSHRVTLPQISYLTTSFFKSYYYHKCSAVSTEVLMSVEILSMDFLKEKFWTFYSCCLTWPKIKTSTDKLESRSNLTQLAIWVITEVILNDIGSQRTEAVQDFTKTSHWFLIRVMMAPEPILGTLSTRCGYTLDGLPVDHRPPWTHIIHSHLGAI